MSGKRRTRSLAVVGQPRDEPLEQDVPVDKQHWDISERGYQLISLQLNDALPTVWTILYGKCRAGFQDDDEEINCRDLVRPAAPAVDEDHETHVRVVFFL